MAYYCFSLANPPVPSSFLQMDTYVYARLYIPRYNVYNARVSARAHARVRYRVTRVKRDDLTSLKSIARRRGDVLGESCPDESVRCSPDDLILINRPSMYRSRVHRNRSACIAGRTCARTSSVYALRSTRSSVYSSLRRSPRAGAHFICMCNYWSRSCLALRYVASPTSRYGKENLLSARLLSAYCPRRDFVGGERGRPRIKRFNRVQWMPTGRHLCKNGRLRVAPNNP